MITKHADALLGSVLAASGTVAANMNDAPWWASWAQGLVLGLAPLIVKAIIEARRRGSKEPKPQKPCPPPPKESPKP